MEKEKTIYVYDHFSSDNPVLLGYLYVSFFKGNEHYSFEYDEAYLNNRTNMIFFDPGISIYSGRQYPINNTIFGAFADASPDRWGRVLMNKRERFTARAENRKPRKLNESDYLLGVFDEARMGGLRFKLDKDGDFQSSDICSAIPPWKTLRSLETASRKLESDDSALDDQWLNQLLNPGSSLGGARPKATIVDPFGEQWIAKFPSKNDDNDTGAWEKVAADLAKKTGLNVPETKLEKLSGDGSTFLTKRFDRNGNRRIHFASAMTLLGKTDGASAEDGSSYLELVSILKAHGCKPKEDLIELWKRIVFNMAISNTDDHLRNHAFILSKFGWRLSPLYDVNPIPYGNELSLNVNENDSSISIELAIESANYFGLDKDFAKKLASDIIKIVHENWEKLAFQYGISRTNIEDMRPAFSLADSVVL